MIERPRVLVQWSFWEHHRIYRRRIPMAVMVQRVAEAHGLAVGDLRGQSRMKVMVLARQEFMAEAHHQGFALSQIGRFLEGRDHTTILHGVRSHHDRIIAADMAEAA